MSSRGAFWRAAAAAVAGRRSGRATAGGGTTSMEATLAAQASRATADVRLQCMSEAGVARPVGRLRSASSAAGERVELRNTMCVGNATQRWQCNTAEPLWALPNKTATRLNGALHFATKLGALRSRLGDVSAARSVAARTARRQRPRHRPPEPDEEEPLMVKGRTLRQAALEGATPFPSSRPRSSPPKTGRMDRDRRAAPARMPSLLRALPPKASPLPSRPRREDGTEV